MQMLMGERTKFLGIVFGVTFAALLMSQQMAIFCGIMSLTTNQIRTIDGIDVWVMDPDVSAIDEFKPLSETALNRVRSVPGVQWAVPFFKSVPQMRLTVAPSEAGWQRKEALRVPKRGPGAPPPRKGTVLQAVALLGLDDLVL